MADVEPTDERLAARAAQGDTSAFEMLYDRHSSWVRAYSAHVLGSDQADDTLQEVFVRMWRAAAQFDPSRGRFVHWMAAIARHHVLRQLRRQGQHVQMLAAESVQRAIVEAADPGAGADERLWRRETAAVMLRALRLLPVEQRQVVVLAYFGGLSQSQIAEQLGLPLGTVKTRVRLAMRTLRSALERDATGIPHLRVVPEE